MNYRNLSKLFTGMAFTAILLAPTMAEASGISLIPSSTTVNVGDTFQVDLVANDIQLGAYDVTFTYNPLLAAIDDALVTFDTHLGAPDNSLAFPFPGLDTLEIFEVSLLTTPSDLAVLQTDPSYPLAHIQVQALLPGTLTLDFVTTLYTAVSDYNGAPIDGVTFQGASIAILAASDPPPPPPTDAVPEPGPTMLLLSGLCFLTSVGLRRKK